MKTLLALTLTGLISLNTLAEEKKIVKTDLNAVRNSGVTQTGSSGKPLIQTDLDRVFSTGSHSPGALQFTLEDGHYILGVDGSDNETHSLFINKSVNDSEKYIALMINNDAFRKDVGSAKIMVGAVINSGAELQFSPTYIDINGNIVVASEGSRTAKVLRISLKQDTKNNRYPYMVRGLNGATNGVLMGMRGAKSNIDLKQRPSKNVFSWHGQNERIVVNGNSMSRHIPGYGDKSYELINLNGDLGAFSSLVNTTEDTMTTDSASDVKIANFAVFLTEKDNQDCLLIGNPVANAEEFAVKLYSPPKKRFWDSFFNVSGRLSPKKSDRNPFDNNPFNN